MTLPDVLYHYAPIPLRAGSVIEPGNWGRIVRRDMERNQNWPVQHAREAMLELYRQAAFPQAPSRLECIFAYRSLDEAKAGRDANSALSHVYSVKVDASSPYHVADMAIYGMLDLTKSYDFLQRLIRAYWSPPSICSTTEVLIGAPVTIVERVY